MAAQPAQSPVDQEELAVIDAADKVATQRNADVFFYSGPIERWSADRFVRKVASCRSRPNAIVLLATFGGSGDAAFRMARALHEEYDGGEIAVLVSTYCKSAGTLFAIGAKEIVMSDLAELGPLDVQISKPDTLFERTSGLTPSQSLSALRAEAYYCFNHFFVEISRSSGYAISAKTAATIAASVTAGLYRPIYGQIDPMRFGEFQRAVQIAGEYGRRLDSWSDNLKDSRSLAKLIGGYPSHEFVIDRCEAETLFRRVSRPTEDEKALAEKLANKTLNALKGDGNAVIEHFAPRQPIISGTGTGTSRTSSPPRRRSPRNGGRSPRNGSRNREASRNGEAAN